LSVDPIDDHHKWVKDVEETQNTTMDYPIIANAGLKGPTVRAIAERIEAPAAFIDDIGQTYGATLPFLLIRLSDGQAKLDATGLEVVRAAQQSVAEANSNADWVDTDGFGMKGDNLHFDAAGQQSIGTAAATTMLGLLP
jgi:hypothetical protein